MTISIQPYVFFDGNCQEALDFYKSALGAEVSVMTFGDAPMEVPPEQAARVMHATLTIGSGENQASFFASDGMPGAPIDSGMRAHISIGAADPETGAKYFNALAEGGTVTMAYEKQFWGDTFGMVTDRFGIKWMVNANGQ